MLQIRAFLVLLLILVVSSVVHAEADRVLTWEEAVSEAKINNPDLVSAREKLNQAKANKGIVQSNGLPQLSANANLTTQKSTAAQRLDSNTYGVNAKQLLFDGFKTAHDLAAAEENIKAAQYNYSVVSSNVRLALRTAYVDLLNAQEALSVAINIQQRRKHSLDMLTLRYQGGAEHKGSLMTSQANLAEADFNIEQAKRTIQLSKRRLVKAMGWRNFMPVAAQGDFNVPAADHMEPAFEQMVDQVPLLKELVAQKEAAKYGVKSARADFFPQIYANAGAGRSDTNRSTKKDDWSAGFSMTLPLFEGGLKQAELAKAKANLGQAQADEKSGRDGVILTLADTWTQWQNSVDNVSVQEKFLEAAKERAQIAEAEYGSGLISFNDWIIIEDNLVNNQRSFLNTQANALIAQANWVQAKGETLDE